MTLDSFCLEDVRCFAGAQDVRVRPLTFLVGENSTGKSTILGCMQAVADYMAGSGIDFNRHPMKWGLSARSRAGADRASIPLSWERFFATTVAESIFQLVRSGGQEAA